MSRFDTRTTTFSSEGRLFQLEYAHEAINSASTTLGIVTEEGIILAANKLVTSPLLDDNSLKEKIYPIDCKTIAAVAGWTADANVLINYVRRLSQNHLYVFDCSASIEKLLEYLCDSLQSFSQYGGLRPFGVSFMFASYDENKRFQLFLTSPAGNSTSWRAAAIGQNNASAQSILKDEWKKELALDDGLKLAAKVLKTVSDVNSSELQAEFAVLTLDEDGKPCYRFLTNDKSKELLQQAPRLNLNDQRFQP